MDNRLKSGDIIQGQRGPIKIVKWLAEGGQGDVYLVEQNEAQKALKWYKPNGMGKKPDAFYQNLYSNYDKGNPDTKTFFWPEDITEWKDGVFGYVMPLRPDNYHEVGEFLLTTARFTSMKTIIDAALNIANAYRILHNRGYAYQDLNDGNFFIDPKNGSVWICDIDNVAPEGTSTGIAGKPGYMAPEIVLEKKMPDSYSDRFSMSIIIFMLFCLTRPLEGKRTFGDTPRTPALLKKVYGSDPHFIMEDINHPEYGPDKIAQKNAFIFWNVLPSYMKELFSNAFSREAIDNPGARPTELRWIQNLVRFRSEIIRCQCGSEVLTENGKSTKCSKCGRKINIPFNLSFTGCNYKIPGLPDSRIYKCQLGPCKVDEALNPVGRVLSNKSNPTQLGIRNLTEKHWDAETPSGKAKKVLPKDIVPLKDNIKLYIGTETVTIEVQ